MTTQSYMLDLPNCNQNAVPFTEEPFVEMELGFRGCGFKQVAHSGLNIFCSFYLFCSLIISCGCCCFFPSPCALLRRILPDQNIIILNNCSK